MGRALRDDELTDTRQARALELIDRLQAMLDELRESVRHSRAPSTTRAIQAFADEALRDRDA
jgi:hypothetical protein